MEQINNPKTQLFFDESFLQVSSDVLKKYKLDETSEEFAEKLKNNERLLGEIYMDVVRGVTHNTIKENEMASLFMEKFNLSKEAAEGLAKDTKEQIIPLISEGPVPAEEPEAPVIENTPLSIVRKPPIMNVEENEKLLKKEREPIVSMQPVQPLASTDTEDLKPSLKKAKRVLAPNKTAEPTPRPERPKGPDSYREPIT